MVPSTRNGVRNRDRLSARKRAPGAFGLESAASPQPRPRTPNDRGSNSFRRRWRPCRIGSVRTRTPATSTALRSSIGAMRSKSSASASIRGYAHRSSNKRLSRPLPAIRGCRHPAAVTWVRLEDSLPEHPKVLAAGPQAAWFIVVALAYCNRHLTDACPSTAAVRMLNGARYDKTLLRVGLLEPAPDGYRIHDFLNYQPSRAEVEENRRKSAAARSAGGRARAIAAHRINGRFAAEDWQQSTSEAAGVPMIQRVPSFAQPRAGPNRPESDSSRISSTGGFRRDAAQPASAGLRHTSAAQVHV